MSWFSKETIVQQTNVSHIEAEIKSLKSRFDILENEIAIKLNKLNRMLGKGDIHLEKQEESVIVTRQTGNVYPWLKR